jgi:hypothetical protein
MKHRSDQITYAPSQPQTLKRFAGNIEACRAHFGARLMVTFEVCFSDELR